MIKSILIGGEAGLGSAVTSAFVGKIFTSLGCYVFNYRDYPSFSRKVMSPRMFMQGVDKNKVAW